MKNESREAVERQESLEETCAVTDLMLPGQGLGIGRAQRLAFECRRLEALAVVLAKAAGRIVCEKCCTQMDYPVSVDRGCFACTGPRSALSSPSVAALLSKAAKSQEVG